MTQPGHVMIAAHRGIAGGNIPCNSMQGFEAALLQGADILELDISVSLDGTPYVFHPKKEPLYLGSGRLISQMHDDEVDALPLINMDGARTLEHVPRFADCLSRFRGRCLINVDKFWSDVPGLSRMIREAGMQDQVIVKSPLKPGVVEMVEQYAPDLPFMPIVREDDGAHEQLLRNPRVRYVGVEALFDNDDAPVASPSYIDKLHAAGCLLWVNAIVYDYRAVLSAGHTDDAAVGGDMDGGWGNLIERGFDIIQTDWPLALRRYGETKYPDRFGPRSAVCERRG